MNSKTSRRGFLKTGLVAAAGTGIGLGLLSRLGGIGDRPSAHPALGALRPVADEATGLPLLLLPEGFRYRTIAWAGDTLGDGHVAPARADGMGVVGQEGSRVTLVRNHELRGSDGPIGEPAHAWDVTGGGTVTLAFDTRSESLVDSRISLCGTLNNCAGGVTPWGTWLSCEEAPYTPELAHHGIEVRQSRWGLENTRKSHGYVFEVHPDGELEPQPIVAMGQFYHEAAATDPATGIVYMTEDQAPIAGFYRYLPNRPGELAAGGRLQMLRAEGFPSLTYEAPTEGQRMAVSWVDIDDPGQGHSPGAHDGLGVVKQGMAAGGTVFISLEGCAWEEGSVYFTSKEGGPHRAGYVFRLDLERQELEVILTATSRNGFSGPDNLVVSPRGSLVICEDRVGSYKEGQCIAGLDDSGRLYEFCRLNPALTGQYAGHDLASTAVVSEWAGVCFSADGQWMFANVYSPGLTCAITGPWVEGLV